MGPIRHILFAIKNPDAPRQPGLRKAVGIARSLGASIELFHALSTPVFLELEPLTGRSVAELEREALALRNARLERLAARARKQGVEVTHHVEWDFPPHEAIIRRAQRSRADLIVAECHVGMRLKPWLMHLTDWELLRLSPMPVLLLKNGKPWRKPLILAAVDPGHANAKPARLDAAIVSQALRLKRALGGTLQAMHASMPTPLGLMSNDPQLDGVALSDLYLEHQRIAQRKFEAFANRMHLPQAARHFVTRDPVFAIPRTASRLGADVVVMGAVSRSGLKRIFIGNTAERVLEALPCDVLVVKSRPTVPRVARKSRGIRLVAPLPLMPMPA